MKPLKAGDRVKFISDDSLPPRGAKGEVVRTSQDGRFVDVRFDTKVGLHDVWHVTRHELRKLKPKTKKPSKQRLVDNLAEEYVRHKFPDDNVAFVVPANVAREFFKAGFTEAVWAAANKIAAFLDNPTKLSAAVVDILKEKA